MFFPELMKRIRILVHDSEKTRLVERLHTLGAVQLTDYKETLSQEDWASLLEAHPASADVRNVTMQLMSVNRLLDIFSSVAPEEEEGFFKTLFAPSPRTVIPVEELSGETLLKEVSAAAESVDDAVAAPLDRLEKTDAEAEELTTLKASLARIQSLQVPLSSLQEGLFVSALLGVTAKRDLSGLNNEIDIATGGLAFVAQADISEEEACILTVCLSEHEDDVAGLLRKWDVERITPGDFQGTPAEAIRTIEDRLRETETIRERARQEIASVAGTWRSRLKALRELLYIERDRAEAFGQFAKTESVTAIEGWVPERKARQIADDVVSESNGLAFSHISQPDQPAEKLPVSLRNPGIIKHFELLVKLYAPPRYNELDPTVLIFPSFLFFFGLMITDAMYGLMTLLLGVFILRGGGRYYPLYRSAGLMLALGGGATILCGAATGGWFGNLATTYLGMDFLNSLVVINPMVDVASFLVFAIAVGLVHLNIGIVVGIIKDLRNNEISEALKNVWIFFLEIALVLYYVNLSGAAVVLAGISLLFLVYSEKGMALFGVTGLLGDSLSYARLMALGLVSFGLAVAINALAQMVWGIDYIGWLIAIVILAAGHVFSFLLNVMGAFAHGIRLHFVEFFGKFYSGGGDEFTPFAIKREITQPK
jgi:V/A-type H+-transporting ATPase subunit I